MSIARGSRGLVIAKNPPLQEGLGKLLGGINIYASQQAQQREARTTLPSPTRQPEPPNIQAILDYLREKFNLPLATAQVHTPPSDEPLAYLMHRPSVILILGHRGNGKTALALRLQELLRDGYSIRP